MKAHSQGGMVGLNMTVYNLSLIWKLVLKRKAHEIKPVLLSYSATQIEFEALC